MYHGTSVSVVEHKSSCSYKDESQLLIITMREVCTRSLKNTPCSGRPVYITSNPSSCYIMTIVQCAIHLTNKRSLPKGACIRRCKLKFCKVRVEIRFFSLPSLQLRLVKESNQELQSSNRELQQSLTKALKSIDRLVAERTAQLEQQALSVYSCGCTYILCG